jgi:hypothetical protein
MKLKSGVAAGVMLAVCGGLAHASNWVQLPELTSDNGNSTYAVDTNTVEISPDGSTVRAWFSQTMRETRPINGYTMTTVKFNNRYYCQLHQVDTGPTIAYDATGKPVYSRGGYQRDEVVPDTVDDHLSTLLCSIAKRK